MDAVESAIEFCEGISQYAQRKSAYGDAWRKTFKVCGSCQHWMKKHDCPRERGMMVGGPTCGSAACDKFAGTDYFHKDVATFRAMPQP